MAERKADTGENKPIPAATKPKRGPAKALAQQKPGAAAATTASEAQPAKAPVQSVQPPAPAPAPQAQPRAPAQPPAPAKKTYTEIITEPLNMWYNYITKSFARYYTGLLKIEFVSLIAQWFLLLVLALISLGIIVGMVGVNITANIRGGIMALLGNTTALVAIILLWIVGIILISWAKATLSLAMVAFTDAEFASKGFGLMEAVSRLKWKTLRYIIAEAIAFILLMLPLIIVIAILVGGGALALGHANAQAASAAGSGAGTGLLAMLMAVPLLIVFSLLYIIIVLFVFGFFAQFWIYGFVVDGKGVIESLKASYRTVRKKPLEVLGFDVLFIIGCLLFSVPVIIYSIVASIPMNIAQLIARVGASPTLWVLYFVLVVLNTLVTILFSTIIDVFSMPSMYLFWKSNKD